MNTVYSIDMPFNVDNVSYVVLYKHTKWFLDLMITKNAILR